MIQNVGQTQNVFGMDLLVQMMDVNLIYLLNFATEVQNVFGTLMNQPVLMINAQIMLLNLLVALIQNVSGMTHQCVQRMNVHF